MAKTNLNIEIDENVKKQAQELFDELGVDISTAVNIFIRQSIRRGGIPFKINCDMPNEETIEAIREADKISRDPNTKRYSNFAEIVAEVNADV